MANEAKTTTITAGDKAIINVDAQLSNVNQIIENSGAFNADQKSELGGLIAAFRAELDAIKTSHATEYSEISTQLEQLLQIATAPKQESNKGLLSALSTGFLNTIKTVASAGPALYHAGKAIVDWIKSHV